MDHKQFIKINHPHQNHHIRNRSHLPHQHSKTTMIYSIHLSHLLISQSTLHPKRFTLYLRLVNHLWNKIVIVFLLQIVKRFLWTSFFLQFLYFHLVVVQFAILRITVLHYFLKSSVLMHGGLKSIANFYGTNPFGGPDFIPFSFYFPPPCFGFSSLYHNFVTII